MTERATYPLFFSMGTMSCAEMPHTSFFTWGFLQGSSEASQTLVPALPGANTSAGRDSRGKAAWALRKQVPRANSLPLSPETTGK